MSDDKNKFGGWLKSAGQSSGGTGAPANPKNVRKRWFIIAGAVAVFSLVVSSFFAPKNSAPPPRKEKTETLDLTPKNSDQKSWELQSQTDIQKLRSQNQDLTSRLDRITKDLDAKAAAQAAASQAPSAPTLPAGVVPPPGALGTPVANSLPPVVAPPSLPAPMPALGGKLPFPPIENGGSDQPLVFKPEAKTSDAGSTAATLGGAVNNALENVKAKVSFKKNAYAGFLPPGAYAPIALLNGLDAGTAAANQSNPQPVLMNIQDNATLPGSANYKLRSCFVLGSAYGDLSAERVYVRLARLSCVDKSSKLVLSSPIQGYIVDSDGKLGLRGVVVSRQGALLGKSLLAGFAQGLSGALGQAEGTTTNSVFGTASSFSGSSALKNSGLSGASSASSQLAQFYLKEAEAIFPVITVDAGRTGNIVFSDGVQLQWGDGSANFTKDVTPEQ